MIHDYVKVDQMVLIIEYDRNNKPHFYVCPNMKEAKLISSGEKREVSVVISTDVSYKDIMSVLPIQRGE